MMTERAEPLSPPADPADDSFISESPNDTATVLVLKTENTALRETIAGLEAENAAREAAEAPEWAPMKQAVSSSLPYSTLQKWSVEKGWIKWRRQPGSKLVEIDLTSLNVLLKRRGRPVE
jgi:hypothetical protein